MVPLPVNNNSSSFFYVYSPAPATVGRYQRAHRLKLLTAHFLSADAHHTYFLGPDWGTYTPPNDVFRPWNTNDRRTTEVC